MRALKLLFASARTLKYPQVTLPQLKRLVISACADLTEPVSGTSFGGEPNARKRLTCILSHGFQTTLQDLLAFLKRLPKLKVFDLRAETLYKTKGRRQVSLSKALAPELSEDASELRAVVDCLQEKGTVEFCARTNASPSEQFFGLYTARAEQFLRWTRQGADFKPSVFWDVLFEASSQA